MTHQKNQRTWVSKWLGLPVIALVLALMVGASIGTTPAGPAKALPGEVLILDTTVSAPCVSSAEAGAVTLAGKIPVCVDAPTWTAMTTAQFAAYDAIVLGDPTCSGVSRIAAPTANAGTWGPAVDGNVIIIGTDPDFHNGSQPGAQLLIENGIAFAVADSTKTGAYITLSCYYAGASSGTPVPMLDGAFGGSFTVIGQNVEDSHIVATHPSLAGLTDANLSNWSNSTHEGFESWPLSFEVLVISEDIPSSYVATDGTTGAPYILARGVTVISDIDLAPLTATNPVGTTHTVTATVTTDSPVAGTPVVGTVVSFSVISGPNTGAVGTCSASVTCQTDASGQVSWTYTGTGGPGTDTIEATFVASSGATQRSNRVEKIWEVPVGADISVAKTCAAAAVPGGSFSCTVTVTNLGPAAATGVSVTITETGALIASATPSQGTCGATPTVSLTCALGNLAVSGSATVAITVQTGVAPGSVSDSATASATESDPNPGNNTATATTGVVVPASTVGCKITDGGRITAANGDKATFGGNAQAPNKGQQEYQDHGPAIDINVHSISITAVVCSADKKSGSIFGTATINGAGSYFFRIDVQDLGEPGTSDTYRIRLSNGYDSGVKVLTGGNIQIHK